MSMGKWLETPRVTMQQKKTKSSTPSKRKKEKVKRIITKTKSMKHPRRARRAAERRTLLSVSSETKRRLP